MENKRRIDVFINDLIRNPFRNIKKFTIDEHYVDQLVQSINDHDFWDNLIGRPAKEKGKYEIAYGHHRLEALKRTNIKKINLGVADLSDAEMIKMMGEENLSHFNLTPKAILETVRVAKEFLDNELKKYKDFNQFTSQTDGSIRLLINEPNNFEKCKKYGVGKRIIGQFLGGNWKDYMIQDALNTLQDDKINEKAVEIFDNQEQVKSFKEVVRKKNIPKKDQIKVAEKVKKVIDKNKKKKTKKGEGLGKTTKDHRTEMSLAIEKANSELKGKKVTNEELLENELISKLGLVDEKCRALKHALNTVNEIFEEIDMPEDFVKYITIQNLKEMFIAMQTTLWYLGIENMMSKEKNNEIRQIN